MTRLRRKTLTSLLASVLLLGVGGLSACSSSSEDGDDAQADGSSDPQTYYEQLDATPTDSMTLAMAVADLAQVVKGAGAAAERSVTTYDVEARVTPLATRGVPGAADLLELSRALGELG